MAIQVHELTPDDFDALLQFAQSLPQTSEPALTAQMLGEAVHCHPGLSLVATQDKTIVGAILAGTGEVRCHRLLVGADESAQDIRRLLIDKAMMKLASRGGRTCHLSTQAQPLEPFWDLARWQDWPQLAPAASPPTPAAAP